VTFAAAQKETEDVNKTVPFPANGTLRLKNFSGDITITGTTGRDMVMKATRRATRDRLDHIKLTVDTSGSTVSINANDRDTNWTERNDNVVETTFEIQVPASARVELDAFSSNVSVGGVTGSQHFKTFSGKITVKDAKQAVDAESFSGALDVDAVAAGVDPDLNLHTFNGKIRVRLADHAKGTMHFATFSGDFTSDFPVGVRSSRKRDFTAELPGGAGHTLNFHTFSGDLVIQK
jgi:DUF4097 and DUF4098 domain-containing protein YvlB